MTLGGISCPVKTMTLDGIFYPVMVLWYCLHVKLWPNRWTKRTVFCHQTCFLGSKWPTNAFAAVAAPRTPLE